MARRCLTDEETGLALVDAAVSERPGRGLRGCPLRGLAGRRRTLTAHPYCQRTRLTSPSWLPSTACRSPRMDLREGQRTMDVVVVEQCCLFVVINTKTSINLLKFTSFLAVLQSVDAPLFGLEKKNWRSGFSLWQPHL